MPDTLHLTTLLPFAPSRWYAAWLDGEGHAEMTGAAATGSPVVGASFSAWDGYIQGKNLELEEGVRIRQSWRAADFPKGAADSTLELHFKAEGAGTRITLDHTNLPDGHGARFTEGWDEFYFRPMAAFAAREKGSK